MREARAREEARIRELRARKEELVRVRGQLLGRLN
jgi:hypothetical protein